jgi:hypothetical protein
LIASARKKQSDDHGFISDDRGNSQMFPTAGKPVENKKYDLSLPVLQVIQVPPLQSDPTLKYWVENREGKSHPGQDVIVDQLKLMRSQGARIMLHVDQDGYYTRAFSNSNGNSVLLEEIQALMKCGYTIGEVCGMTKLICGVGGRCGPKGDMCQVCKDYSTGNFTPVEIEDRTERPKDVMILLKDYPTDFAKEIATIISNGTDYKILAGRIVNQENSRSSSLDDVLSMCNEMKKGPRYILEMLGVMREREAATNTALKKGDLGGH